MRQKVTSREQILQVALQIALREGIDKVNIRKLARECQIAIGSMYNYYSNKDALIKAVAETFWETILKDQEMLYRKGMTFTMFLEQYYQFLYGRLSRYDSGWLSSMNGRIPQKKEAVALLRKVLENDSKINPSIWNMELNQEAFVDYVFSNLIALLQTGESNCRFFLYLLEHLLYDE